MLKSLSDVQFIFQAMQEWYFPLIHTTQQMMYMIYKKLLNESNSKRNFLIFSGEKGFQRFKLKNSINPLKYDIHGSLIVCLCFC